MPEGHPTTPRRASGPVWRGYRVRAVGQRLELHRDRTPWLAVTVAPRVDGVPVVATRQDWRIDPDEVELAATGGGMSWRVRHTFADHWHTRISVAPEPLQPPDPADAAVDVELDWRVEAATGWCWASGADGLVAVLGAGAEAVVSRPRLGRLLPSTVPGQIALGRFPLGPGAPRLVTLRTGVESPAEVAAALPAWLPTLERVLGDPLELTHPDAALVLPRGLDAERQGEVSLVHPEPTVPGEWDLQLHGPGGETRLRASWSEPPEEVLRQRAQDLLRRAPRRQGVAVLGSTVAGLLVGRGGLGPEAEEASARVLETGGDQEIGDDPWRVLLAVEQHQRREDGEALARARQLLTRLALVPGAPTAAMAVLVAEATSGLDPAPTAARLAGWGAGTDAEGLLALELQVLSGRLDRRGLEVAAAVLTHLGSGLPGEPLHRADPVPLAHQVTLLRWLPDVAASRLAGELLPGTGLAELVQRTERRLLARPELPPEALAWLTTTVLER